MYTHLERNSPALSHTRTPGRRLPCLSPLLRHCHTHLEVPPTPALSHTHTSFVLSHALSHAPHRHYSPGRPSPHTSPHPPALSTRTVMRTHQFHAHLEGLPNPPGTVTHTHLEGDSPISPPPALTPTLSHELSHALSNAPGSPSGIYSRKSSSRSSSISSQQCQQSASSSPQ